MAIKKFGNIRVLKSGRVEAWYYLPTGEQVPAGTFETVEQAQDRLDEIEVDLRRGAHWDGRKGRTKFRDFMVEYMDLREKLVTPGEFVNNRSYLSAHLLAGGQSCCRQHGIMPNAARKSCSGGGLQIFQWRADPPTRTRAHGAPVALLQSLSHLAPRPSCGQVHDRPSPGGRDSVRGRGQDPQQGGHPCGGVACFGRGGAEDVERDHREAQPDRVRGEPPGGQVRERSTLELTDDLLHDGVLAMLDVRVGRVQGAVGYERVIPPRIKQGVLPRLVVLVQAFHAPHDQPARDLLVLLLRRLRGEWDLGDLGVGDQLASGEVGDGEDRREPRMRHEIRLIEHGRDPAVRFHLRSVLPIKRTVP